MPKKLQAKEDFDELLLECVNIQRLRTVLEGKGLDVPPNIDSDVLGMLRIVAAKFQPRTSGSKEPMKLSEMGKALRPVFSGDSYAARILGRRWLFIPSDDKVGFIRGWHESIYSPATAKTLEEQPRIADIAEDTIDTGNSIYAAAIEQRIPRTIRYRRGTYANTIFNFPGPDISTGVVELDSSPEPIRRTKKRISVSTEELATAMLLLRKAGAEVIKAAYQPWGYLVLATDLSFVAFTQWTKDLGPQKSKKKVKKPVDAEL